MMTKRAKWGVTAAILLMIAGMIAYPQLKNKFKASQDAASVVPTSGTSLRNQTLNINAEVLKYQSLTDKIMSTGSTLPDEEVDLAFESSGNVRALTHGAKSDDSIERSPKLCLGDIRFD